MSLWMTWYSLHSWEWPLAQKLALPKKDMIQWTVTGLVCNKKRANYWMSTNLPGGKDTDVWTVSQNNPQNTESLREAKVRLGKINM